MRWRATYSCKVMAAVVAVAYSWVRICAGGAEHNKDPKSSWMSHPYPEVAQADWACCRRAAVLQYCCIYNVAVSKLLGTLYKRTNLIPLK